MPMWGVYQLLASTVHSGLEKLIQKYVKSAFYLKGARWRSMVAKKPPVLYKFMGNWLSNFISVNIILLSFRAQSFV